MAIEDLVYKLERAKQLAGGSTTDKIDRIFDTIQQGVARSLALKKGRADLEKANLEIEKAQREQTPISNVLGEKIPSETEMSASATENKARFEKLRRQALGLEPNPVTDGQFETGLSGIEEMRQDVFAPDQLPNPREEFIRRKGFSPDIPLWQAKELAATEATRALAETRQQPIVWVNPYDPREFSYTPKEGWLSAKSASALSSASRFGAAEAGREITEEREKRRQQFQRETMVIEEALRLAAEERALGRKSLEEVRPKINSLNQNISLGEELLKKIEMAERMGLNVTGLFSEPWNRFREKMGTMSKEEQDLLTTLRLNFADFVRERGGTAFTPTERAVFGPIMPQEEMDEQTNINRIKRMLEILDNKKTIFKQDYPAAFGGGGAPSQGAPLQPKQVAPPALRPTSPAPAAPVRGKTSTGIGWTVTQ